MRRFRMLPLVLVLAVALSGCARAQAGRIAATQEIAAGDKLFAAKDYDGALDRYVKAANECTESPVHEEALSKAANALTAKVEDEPLPVQLAAFHEFMDEIPDPVLPLRAHNWLSDTLRADAEAALTQAKALSAENKRVLVASTPQPAAKKPVAKKPAAKKPVAKKTTTKTTTTAKTKAPAKPVVKPASATATAAVITTSSASATVSAAATRSVAATASTVATEPAFVLPSAGELRSIAASLPALGQPPAMEQLYQTLAEIKAVMQASDAARAPYSPRRPLTLAQRRTLGACDARLTKALQNVDRLLASL